MRQRAKHVIKIVSILLAVGLLYAVFVRTTGLWIPCLFRTVTGFLCPGCGVSHMCMALLQLDFKSAWESNPAVFSMLPVGAVLFVYTVYVYIKTGKWPSNRWYNAVVAIMIIILLVFGFVRNLGNISTYFL